MPSYNYNNGGSDYDSRPAAPSPPWRRNPYTLAALSAAAGVAGGVAWLALYRVHNAKANQALVKTGLGLATPRVTRTAFVRLPYQEVEVVDLGLHELSVDTVVRSNEMQQLVVKAGIFVSVGDATADAELFARRFPFGSSTDWADVVAELLHGQFREYAANKTAQQVFDGRTSTEERPSLTDAALAAIKDSMGGLGLKVHRLVIKDMDDVKDGTYFKDRARKVAAVAKSDADAAVAVAEAEAKKRTATAEADAAEVVATQTQRTLVAAADTQVKRAEQTKRQDTAKNETEQAVAQRLAELAAATERARAAHEIEALRARDMAAATVKAEATVKEAGGAAEARERAAAATLFEALRAADGVAAQGAADASALKARLDAHAAGMAAIVTAMGGSADAAVRYVALADGTILGIAQATAEGVRGMAPKLNVWAANGGQLTDALQATAGGLPAFAAAIKDTSGVDLAAILRGAAAAAAPFKKVDELR